MIPRITVQTNFVGIHFWADAPAEVAFLRHPHRHIFCVAASCDVNHNDRELEFFMVKQRIDNIIRNNFRCYHKKMPDIKYVGEMSCEMIAALIAKKLKEIYGRPFIVTVREDTENMGTASSP